MPQTFLIDTNVFLDLILKRAGYQDAREVFQLFGENDHFDPWMAPHCLATIFYLARKELGKKEVLLILQDFLRVIRLAPLDENFALNSFSYGMSDFEDALQAASAEAIGADVIITRNTKDFKKSPVPCLTPSEFLRRYHSAPEE